MLAAVLGLVVAGAQTSQAGQLTVNFDLGASTLNLAGQTNVPGDGGAVAGSVSVSLSGVDAAGNVTAMGGGSLQNFNLSFMLNNNVMGLVTLTGSIAISQIGIATGAFDGMGLALGTGNFVNQLNVFVGCQDALGGAICAQAGAFPVVQNTMIANATGPFTFNLLGLGMMGNGVIQANLSVMNAGQAVALNFTGTEVNRMFDAGVVVPEPLQASLLGLGLLGLVGAGVVVRRRRASA